MSLRDKFRKYKCGNEKRKLKEKKELFLKSQKGSFELYLSQQNNSEKKESENINSDINFINNTQERTEKGENICQNLIETKLENVNSPINFINSTQERTEKGENICQNLIETEFKNYNSDIKFINNNQERTKKRENICTNLIETKFEIANNDVNPINNTHERIKKEKNIGQNVTETENEVLNVENETNKTINVDDKYSYSWSDPANWPQILTQRMLYEIIKIGPTRVENYDFPIRSYENGQNRRFSSHYYRRKLSNDEIIDREWLVYSKIKDSVYCFPCKLFQKEVHGKSSDSHLMNIGLNDWKHLTEKLIVHERSKIHFQSIQSWIELKLRISHRSTIDEQQLALIEKEKDHWRSVLKRVIAIIHYLAKNNDALRGPSDVLFTKNNGHFLGVIEMLNKFDPIIMEHVKRIQNHETHVHYLGHEVQKEIISLMANKIRKTIIDFIKKAKYFTVIMDCTPDISHNEQLSLLFRVVNMYENESRVPDIQEYFLDFIPVKSTTGLNLSNVFIDQLNEYGIDIMNCRGQAYDNGSNMVGKYQGVQTRIINQNQRAFFTPCASHNLNLVLRDAAKNSVRASTFFGTVQRVFTIFTASTSRWDIYKTFCTSFTVKQWSETRWESRVNSVKAIRFELSNIIQALEEVSSTAHDTTVKSEARSLANEMSSYEFILSVIIWYEILVQVNLVSKSLQGKNIDINISSKMLHSLLVFLKSYRNSGFQKAKITANELAEEIGVDPVFQKKRPRKKRKLFDYEGDDDRTTDEEDSFRKEYFLLIVDQSINSIENRFTQIESYNDFFGFLFCIGKLRNMPDEDLLKHCKDLEIRLKDGFSKDIDSLELYNELVNFRFIVNEETTPLEALVIVKNSKGCFPNIGIALRILLTVPVTSACAERSFSKLKLIKTYLRSKLSQENLSGLSIISIEKTISETLDYDDIINEFSLKKSRRVKFH